MIGKEVKKLVDKSATLLPEECTMEAIKLDGYNLVNIQETRMAVFPL